MGCLKIVTCHQIERRAFFELNTNTDLTGYSSKPLELNQFVTDSDEWLSQPVKSRPSLHLEWSHLPT